MLAMQLNTVCIGIVSGDLLFVCTGIPDATAIRTLLLCKGQTLMFVVVMPAVFNGMVDSHTNA